jgi:hypothetical protein
MSSSNFPEFKSIAAPKDQLTPYEYNVQNERILREVQIAHQSAQLLREELAHCVRTEGINSNVNCYDLRKKYFNLLQDRYRGMLFPEGGEPSNRDVPAIVYMPPKDSA